MSLWKKLTRTQWIILIILAAGFIGAAGILPFFFASVIAFVPAFFYLKSIRSSEEKDAEPWETIWVAFAWGGLSGVFLAIILNTIGTLFILGVLYGTSEVDDLERMSIFIGAVIVAPIVEEFVKPLVMLRNAQVKKEIDEVEDGIVYGAACGLGFGATENVLYGLSPEALAAGVAGIFFIVVLRTFSSILLHLVASSFTGYGIAKYQVEGQSFGVVIKYYFLAVFIHGAWNAMAISSLYYDNDLGSILLFLFSIVLAIGGLEMTKRKIREIDVAGSNIYGTNIRAGQGNNEWSSDKWESKSGWEQKKLRSSSVDTGAYSSNRSGQTADALYESSTKTPEELASSTKEWAVGFDWRGAIGFIIFLFYILSGIIF